MKNHQCNSERSEESFYCVGIDVGSRTTKAVILNGSRVLGRSFVATGWTPDASAEKAFREAMADAELTPPASVTPFRSPPVTGGDYGDGAVEYRIVATGYGRVTVPFADRTITEITAHARGVGRQLPHARTLIDVGGQDSKVMLLEEGGLVTDFAMNDRCAAGSGKFLEFLALSMNLSVEEFAELAFSSHNPVSISSICTVFAESEVLSLLAEGAMREDVAAGVHRSIAQRVAQLAHSLHPLSPVAFSGGVAYNRCMIRELSFELGCEIIIPEMPEYTGALGAAIVAAEGM
ncbi:2-hydroxyglutaryl-CoA dehydratase [bacterium]|nr:2-hydroxyglutaryl-CoA dehydratase [bacterium]